jgi:Leucine-rich repeat (LRR) protein
MLGELEVLSFYRNNISIIPDEIGGLSRMKRFNCGANPVRSLPVSMAQMKELESLQLDRTLISSVPEVCRALPSLKRLSLRAAPLIDSGVSGIDCLGKPCQLDVGKCRAALFSLNVI